MRLAFPLFLLVAATAALGSAGVRAAPPDFTRDVRPILSNKCFRCHGPDEEHRKGGQNGLRLDVAQGALADLGGGGFAVVPGHPEKSELIARVTSADEEEVMPPRKSDLTLTKAEIEVLRQWIAAGASYARHWSYEKPRRAALPDVRDTAWPRNGLDRFILARLEHEGLRPQPEADRLTLARRVALDLTGLPPTLAEVDALAADSRADAYERFVDRQLAKPAFGEHWARAWLDLARYADSKGYADDQPRMIWAYRDYVIDALNRNVPFDQFTIEQLAGDLLPNPTQAQLFATGFHRNTMNNTEGGTDDEEFRSVAVVDRVNTTMAVWMGTSIACAQCHSHKYDPLSQKEYFQLYAILNQTEDADRNDEAPVLEFFTEEQKRQRAGWEAEVAAIERTFDGARKSQAAAAAQWVRQFPARLAWQVPAPGAVKATAGSAVRVADDQAVEIGPVAAKETATVELAVDAGRKLTALQIESLPAAGRPEGAGAVVSRVRVAIKPAEPFRRARYVRVESPGKARFLSFAELEVFSGGRNIAGTGVANQVSTAEKGEARRAIDGSTDGDFAAGSVILTEVTDNPWWELDLGATQALERVVLWGRRGEDGTPSGLRISVLDEARQPVFEQLTRELPRPKNTIDLSQPREVRLARAAADTAAADYDLAAVITDAEPRARGNRASRPALKKGWSIPDGGNQPHALAIQPERPLTLALGEALVVTLELPATKPKGAQHRFRFGVTGEARAGDYIRLPASTLAALRQEEAGRTDAQRDELLDYYVRQVAPELRSERERLLALHRQIDEQPLQSSPILRELPADKRRPTHVQLRGNFQALGEPVEGGVPAIFPPLPEGAPANRLTLARWLVSPDNPLSARVLANRLWEAVFGLGLVRTTEEFGSQGELPTHPELLDWLAVELLEGGWDQKKFLRLLVTSAAYRQGSPVTPAALAADPENRLLSRGPRFRLSAEMVRDQALAVSGLLSPKMFGAPARPYQPAFDLRAAFGSVLDWKTSAGEDRHRRGLYTEWRRSSPYPSMVTFDAPNREVCTLRRNRTNTPLQALVTLNDPVYVEAAQALARLLGHGGAAVEDKVRDGFRRVLLRPPAPAEVAPLAALYRRAQEDYARNPEQAAALIANPENPPPPTFAAADLAAWTVVSNVLLNLDETLMKR